MNTSKFFISDVELKKNSVLTKLLLKEKQDIEQSDDFF